MARTGRSTIEASSDISRTKRSNPQVAINGIANITALSHVIAEFSRAYDVVEAQIRERALQHFITAGCETGSRPENIRAVEQDHVEGFPITHAASVELRAKGAASPLSDDAVTLCVEYNIPLEPVEKKPAAFVINPACLTNTAVIEKIKTAIETALRQVPDLPPDAVVFQPAETAFIATDATLNTLFARRHPKLVREVLPMISSALSISRCTFDSPPGREDVFARAMQRAGELLQNEAFRRMMQLFAEQRAIETRMERRKSEPKGRKG